MRRREFLQSATTLIAGAPVTVCASAAYGNGFQSPVDLADGNQTPDLAPGETRLRSGNLASGGIWERRSLRVAGVERTFVVRFPEQWQGAPLLLGFHGHGGNGTRVAGGWRLAAALPEFIAVFPDGLPTRTPRDPEGERPGWSLDPRGNRDLDLVDALLDLARSRWGIDVDRIAAAGHSNGAGFTYRLHAHRPHVFSAFVAVAGSRGPVVGNAQPAALMAVAGTNDRIVAISAQERAIRVVRQINADAAPVEWVVHDGAHEWPVAQVPRMASFIRSQRRIKDPLAPVR